MIRLALARPISTLVAVAGLAALGFLSLAQLPVSLLPDVERPAIVVTATAPDRSRDEMAVAVTGPFERSLSGVSGLARFSSETEDGRVRIELEPEWQADADSLLIEVARRLDGAATVAVSMDVALAGGDAAPVVEVAVRGGESAAWRSAFARDVLRPELARLPGAARVEVVGLAPAALVVRPRAADLAARGLTAEHVRARLDGVGRIDSAGVVSDGAVQRPLVVHDTVRSLEDLAGLEIQGPRGPTPLGDVATVSIDEVPDGTAAMVDGEEAVVVAAWRAPGANAVTLASAVRDRVEAAQSTAPPGVRLDVVGDASREVVAAVSELVLAAILGLLLGTLVLRAMLGRWAPTLALCVVVPVSLLGAFAAFRLFGVPLDVVSLSGLALAAGMLVDNSIVVVEAIESARARGEREPALSGTTQVALAVVASCATALVVFLPLLYLKGLARAFFGEQAFAVTASLSVSLLLSLTLTPLLSARHASGGRMLSPGLGAARTALDAALARPRLALGLGAAVTAGTLLALLALPRELFPAARPTRLRVAHELPSDLSPARSRERALQLGREIHAAIARSGVEASALTVQGGVSGSGDAARFTVGRTDIVAPDPAAARRMRVAVEEAIGAMPSLRAHARWRASSFVESLAGRDEGLVVVVSSPDASRLRPLADEASSMTLAASGLTLREAAARLPEGMLEARWDEPRLARLGIARRDLERQVRAGLGGLDLGRVEMRDVEPSIRLAPTEPGRLDMIPIAVPGPADDGATTTVMVPARALLSTEERPRAPVLWRENGRPALKLVAEGSVADPEAVARTLARVATRPGEAVALSGAALELQRAFAQLRLVALLSLVLCFLTVAIAYESLLLPILNMSAVPVAFGGGLLLLALTGQSLNVMSFIGLIVLGGLATNHCVVLVDRIEQLRAAGSGEDDAIRGAVAERYRPVLMTTLTMILGMLPLAILPGEGEELRRALATAVLGGLVTSTLATIVLVPVMHRAIEPMRRRRP